MDYQNATSFNTETNAYQKYLPFSIGNLTKITTISLNRIYGLPNWPHRKLWVEINARVNFIKELLTQHLSNDVSEIVVSYVCYDVTVCKLSNELKQESEEKMESDNNPRPPKKICLGIG